MSPTPEIMNERCSWCGSDPLYVSYHDEEWGQPTYDDQQLLEMICLEGAQAGLSWITILKKREGYRELFYHFDAEKMAGMTEEDVMRLKQDPRIVRHEGKIRAFVANAQAYLKMRASGESLSDFVWKHVNHQQIVNRFIELADFPAKTPESDALSKALKKAGFKFVGSTTMYAFMQAAGLVDDHVVGCYRKGKKN